MHIKKFRNGNAESEAGKELMKRSRSRMRGREDDRRKVSVTVTESI